MPESRGEEICLQWVAFSKNHQRPHVRERCIHICQGVKNADFKNTGPMAARSLWLHRFTTRVCLRQHWVHIGSNLLNFSAVNMLPRFWRGKAIQVLPQGDAEMQRGISQVKQHYYGGDFRASNDPSPKKKRGPSLKAIPAIPNIGPVQRHQQYLH